MTALFTPGPWFTERGDSVVKISSGNRVLAATATKAYYERADETDEANAKLIAASPSLFNAATMALDYILNRVGNDAAETVVVADLRAAIAKARGES
jgi:hypothetical protein